ncbi:unnamed protein product [Ceratitis capitata]|uniref:(Mediterranean fruit fly) hypothetical protein n=1 Tax=Ceratitis capitata TaxID=7213 RepID=A0A811UCG9_CERCA|nr:unnamed protein product [Ceratitis capitata]
MSTKSMHFNDPRNVRFGNKEQSQCKELKATHESEIGGSHAGKFNPYIELAAVSSGKLADLPIKRRSERNRVLIAQ